MIDKEKIVNAFVLCRVNEECSANCPYWDNYASVKGCTKKLATDVYSILKEQEAVEPTVSSFEEHDGHVSWWYQCGKCKMPIDFGDRFCRHCGGTVKWND